MPDLLPPGQHITLGFHEIGNHLLIKPIQSDPIPFKPAAQEHHQTDLPHAGLAAVTLRREPRGKATEVWADWPAPGLLQPDSGCAELSNLDHDVQIQGLGHLETCAENAESQPLETLKH